MSISCETKPLSSAEAQKVFFSSGGEDPLSNVSAGTGLQATAESAEASARITHPRWPPSGEVIFCALLPRMACVPCVTVKMACKIF